MTLCIHSTHGIGALFPLLLCTLATRILSTHMNYNYMYTEIEGAESRVEYLICNGGSESIVRVFFHQFLLFFVHDEDHILVMLLS